MTIDFQNLPDNAEVPRQMVVELATQLEAHERRCQRVMNILEQLLRWRYGQKREKIDERQLVLFALQLEATGGDVKEVIAELEAEQEHRQEEEQEDGPEPPPASSENNQGERRGHGRRPLPRTLLRERIEHELSEAERTCPHCAEPMARIGEEVSQRLEYVPASLKVIDEVRGKYAYCSGSGMKTAQPVEKSLAGASLLAQVAVSKYNNHTPLHRQEQIFERHGVNLSVKTMCDWMGRTARLLEPLSERMKARVFESKVVQTDDTPVAMLDTELPKTRTGRMWTYVGADTTVYDYTPTRKREGPERFLEGYRGHLQADAYGSYDALFDEPERGLTEVGCMAHARRKFFDARSSNLQCVMPALAYIRLLYRVERRARGLSSGERGEMRQRWAAPLMGQFRDYLERVRTSALPKSPEGVAINYALSNWKALSRYLEDGDLSIDNNGAERSLRGVVVGRKNWLFYGSDRGGRTAAVLNSIMASCRQIKLDPWAYLKDVLGRIAMHPVNALDELLPVNWKPASA